MTTATDATTEPRHGAKLIKATLPFAQERVLKSWLFAISTSLILAGCWTLTFLGGQLAVTIPASVLTGMVMVRLFVIYHDHQHGAILRQSKLANFLMSVWGMFVLAPSSVWKSSHDYHHRNNCRLRSAHIGSFPIMTVEGWQRADRGQRTLYRFMRHPLLMAFGYPIVFFFGMCIGPFLRNPKRHWDGLVATIVHIALSVAVFIFLGWQVWLIALVIPYTVACAVGSYLFYAQHNFPGVTFSSDGDWTYHSAALDSSSMMRMGPLMRWFTAEIGLHHIHHLNARIPFYRLRETMGALPELQNPPTTSLSPLEIIRCLRLALWDDQQQRMIGYRDLKRRNAEPNSSGFSPATT